MELLITLTITVVGMAGLLSLHFATLKGNQGASRFNEATVAAKESIERLRQMTIDDIETDFGVLPITDAVLDTIAGRAGMTYSVFLSAEELTVASPDLIRLRVDVDWTDDGAIPGSLNGIYDHTISLEVVITRQEAL